MNKNKEIAIYTLEALKKAGADHAQCIVSSGVVDEINVENGEFSKIRSLFDGGIVMKAIKDNKKGVIALNNLELSAIDFAAKECVDSAMASASDDAVRIAELTTNKNFSTGISVCEREAFFDRVNEYVADIKNLYPKITLEQLIASYVYGESILMNTNGVEYEQKNGYYSISPMFSAQDEEHSTSFNYFGIIFSSLDEKLIDMGMQKSVYEQTEKQLEAAPFEGKFSGKALIVPLCLNDFIDMAIGNFVSDSNIINGTSPWRYSLGKKVASESLTLSIKPNDKRMVSGERVTDDGYISQDYDIIKNGILESFSLTDYAARKTGEERALNSSGCVVVKEGQKSLDDIIAKIDKGIMVCRFSGGAPATNGDFSGVAKNSFLIENGKITKAVTETMISGNLASMLKSILDISKETVCDGASVLPWVLFDGITVSGK